VVAESVALASEGLLDRPPDDGLTHVEGQGLDRVEIEVERRSFVSIGASGDDFPPPVGQLAKVGAILGWRLAEWHRVFVLELANKREMGISS
jgi:hypothetical protein